MVHGPLCTHAPLVQSETGKPCQGETMGRYVGVAKYYTGPLPKAMRIDMRQVRQ